MDGPMEYFNASLHLKKSVISTTSKSIGQQGQMDGVVVMISPHLGQVGRGDISNAWGSLSATTPTAS
jgi:hypothetical protein